jgi:uncharacterized protein YjiS (DUF1127 family)
MSMITTHNTPIRQSSPSILLLAAVASMPVTWIRRVRGRRELMRLLSQPDYLLQDIGLQRDAITREGLKRFWVS